MKFKKISKKSVAIALSVAMASGTLAVTLPHKSYAASAQIYTKLADNIQDGTILHCFDWTYQQIIDELPNIKAAGFTSVQTSPAQQAVKGYDTWYYLYQPNTFTIGNSGLGSESDLKRLCSEAEKLGIKVIVDVVANHLAGDHSNIDYTLKDSQYWHNGGNHIDYTNRYEITHNNIGMPDINSEHSYVQQKVKNYIQQLKSDGVDGIRFDAAKHISLPSESCGFWSAVIDKTMFNYGEILDAPVMNNSSAANKLMAEYTDYMSVTDSIYSSTVLGAIQNGSVPEGYANWATVSGIDSNEIVYWGESHDTYSNDTNEGGWTKYISQNNVDRAYAIVASRSEATALYFSRPYQTAKTAIKVGQKGSTHFTSKEVAAVNHLHNACIGEADYYLKDGNKAVITRKSGAVIVLGSGSNQNVSVKNGGSLTTPGTYIDEISGNTFTVTSSTISGKVGSTGIAVFYKVSDTTPTPDPVTETRTIYLDTNSCSWFGTDSAVAAYMTDKDSSYKNMTKTTVNNKSVYKADINANATKVTIVRMLPSGKYYNALTFNLSSNNYYTSNSGWSSVTGSVYQDVVVVTPEVSISKATGTYKDSVSVTITAKNAEKASYTLNGTTKSFTNSVTLTITSTSTLSVSASNGSKTASASATYTIEKTPVSDMITVYFSNNGGWSNVYAYTWGGSKNTASWPGTKMTFVKTNEYGESIYKAEIASDVKGLIFSNGSGKQTVDITTGIKNGNGYYLTTNGSKCSVGSYTYK